MCVCAQIGLALCAPLVELSYRKELSQYWVSFPHGTGGLRSRCCSESAGGPGGLCLLRVWFGWEKHPAGRCQPEHAGRLLCQLNSLAARRTQVKPGPLGGQGRAICGWVVSWEPAALKQHPAGERLGVTTQPPMAKTAMSFASICLVWGPLAGSSHE